MLDICTSCSDSIKCKLKLFKSIAVPDDRLYIFRAYILTARGICIECYIMAVLMFQELDRAKE